MEQVAPKNVKTSKMLLNDALMKCLLNVHKLHLESPFGNDVVSLDFLQYRILEFIDENPSSIKNISLAGKINRKVVNSNVSYLLKSGLVEKQKSKTDGRGTVIILNDYGKEILKEVRKQVEELFSFSEQKYSIKQERTMISFFEDFSSAIENSVEK